MADQCSSCAAALTEGAAFCTKCGASQDGAAAPTKPLNITQRVSMRGGLIGLFSGESQGAALDRVLPEFNAHGYRVSFVVADEWSFVKTVLVTLVSAATLFIWGARPNVVIIGERVD